MMMNAAIILSQKLQTKSGMMFLDLIQNWSQHSAAAIQNCQSALVSHIKAKHEVLLVHAVMRYFKHIYNNAFGDGDLM
jgi:hypothetical protein